MQKKIDVMHSIIKKMEDYTNEELLALTDDQIKDTVNLECAHAGVRLLPDVVPVKPDGKKPDKDVAYFTIGSVDFVNQVDANEVADLIATKPVITKKYSSGPGYSYVHTGSETNRPAVDTQMIFSESYLNTVLLEKTAIEEAEKLYEELRDEYDSISDARGKIVTTLYDMIGEARCEKELHDTLRLEFKKYMGLALADEEIAVRFMVSARPDHEEWIKKNYKSWILYHVTETMTNAA